MPPLAEETVYVSCVHQLKLQPGTYEQCDGVKDHGERHYRDAVLAKQALVFFLLLLCPSALSVCSSVSQSWLKKAVLEKKQHLTSISSDCL